MIAVSIVDVCQGGKEVDFSEIQSHMCTVVILKSVTCFLCNDMISGVTVIKKLCFYCFKYR